jgi:hypothetical protein
MAFLRDHLPEGYKPEHADSIGSRVTAEEKKPLYARGKSIRKKNSVWRTIGFILVFAAIGALSAAAVYMFAAQ